LRRWSSRWRGGSGRRLLGCHEVRWRRRLLPSPSSLSSRCCVVGVVGVTRCRRARCRAHRRARGRRAVLVVIALVVVTLVVVASTGSRRVGVVSICHCRVVVVNGLQRGRRRAGSQEMRWNEIKKHTHLRAARALDSRRGVGSLEPAGTAREGGGAQSTCHGSR
jgi:hypothetical protein